MMTTYRLLVMLSLGLLLSSLPAFAQTFPASPYGSPAPAPTSGAAPVSPTPELVEPRIACKLKCVLLDLPTEEILYGAFGEPFYQPLEAHWTAADPFCPEGMYCTVGAAENPDGISCTTREDANKGLELDGWCYESTLGTS